MGSPSCSAVAALERQEPVVNPPLANHALALLARLLRYGSITYQSAFVILLEQRLDANYMSMHHHIYVWPQSS